MVLHAARAPVLLLGASALGTRRMWLATAALLALAAGGPALAADGNLPDAWRDAASAEQRLRGALAGASADDALILRTQIARALSLRREFERARAELAPLKPRLAAARPEAQVRFQLEWGRTWVSPLHEPEVLHAAAREQARQSLAEAVRLARAPGDGRLDALAVEALHLMAFADESPAEALRWNQQALQLAQASLTPAARRWQRPLRQEVALNLRALGRHAEALAEFEQVLALDQDAQQPLPQQRAARWQIARTLRDLGRDDEALARQLQLEREGDAARIADARVFDELQRLYQARGDRDRADHYARLMQVARR